jgi:cytochrome c-type biogenesis protein CcmE
VIEDDLERESTDAGPWRPATARRRRRVPRSRLIAVGLILAASAGFLLYKGVSSAVVYFKTANEALAARSSLGNSTFQMEGVVVAKSINHRAGSDVTAFVVASGKARVHVRNVGTPPQLFGANVPVVLVGHFVGTSNLFASDQILVKHSNQYIAQHRARVRAPNGSVR